jgi:hypothetical protein
VYFWLQEPASDKDEELLLRCNKAVHGMGWSPPGLSDVAAATGPSQQAGTLPVDHEARLLQYVTNFLPIGGGYSCL